MERGNKVDHQQLKPSVVLTGTAKEGSVGPPVGLVDIGVSEGAYLFRVALTGIQRDQCKVKCEINRDGKVQIQGVISNGAMLKDSSAYHMRVQQLCPVGPFTISFNLPGPVDPRLFSPYFRPDGILEVMVMKYKMHTTPGHGQHPHF
ncbi:increased DNA methylation 3-like [Mangifera indica]|uniref:increased DNA methylation 3-like n=1 Tax=Mangifera indica TaxID=29780 RepID=UPI001CFA6386|nr:increased DNA methylation 3-like [Mangifera indica]XP_044475157.1 increased DNA methylation 3-like [Mangifera indica]XP_044475158.1 increased DNA methylation 3-like [Mangifera indica]XP_044475159.1 increased DNA methylation 3-like [Mangifera indica]